MFTSMHTIAGFLLAFFLTSQPLLASALPMDEHVRVLQTMSKKLGLIARTAARREPGFFLGNMYSQIYAREHRCFALGIRFGLGSSVHKLHFSNLDEFKSAVSSSAHDTSVRSAIVDAQLQALEYEGKRLPEPSARSFWNTDCAGYAGIPKKFMPAGMALKIFVRNQGQALELFGDIEAGYAATLRQALDANQNTKEIWIGSGGGKVYEAMEAGREIRKRNLTTRLMSNCFSACPLVFLGGVERVSFDPYRTLGFHQVYEINPTTYLPIAVSRHSQVYADIAAYVRTMGASEKFVIANMLGAGPLAMTEIEAGNIVLCKSRVTTWVKHQILCD